MPQLHSVATRLLALLAVNLGLVSCVVWPDPYHMQIYRATDGPVERGGPPFNSPSDSPYLVGRDLVYIYIQASGTYLDEAYPPYRVSLRILSGGGDAPSITIHSISVEVNGKHIDKVTLRDIRTDFMVPVPGEISRAQPAPCCRLMAVSNWLDINHNPGDLLTVTVELTSRSSSGVFERTVTRTFEAVVKRGLFQVDGFPG